MFTPREQLIWSLERRSNRLKLYGISENVLVLGMTLRFLPDDASLLKLLLLGRDYHETLRKPVYKQALLRSSQHRLKDKRMTLWCRILDIPLEQQPGECPLMDDYLRFKLRAQEPEHLSKGVSDAIEVDVARSFNHMKDIQARNLNNILKAYATVNPEALDYCQGMNFIAGFLFMTSGKREELAFALLKELISRFSMHDLFD